MLSEGAWIAVATFIGGGFGTAIAAIIKLPSPKASTAPSLARTSAPDPHLCPAHSGLVADIKALTDGIKRIEDGQKDGFKDTWSAIEEVRNDIKTLLTRRRNDEPRG